MISPCPFCGDLGGEITETNLPRFDQSDGYKIAVYCNACFCEGPASDTKEEAIQDWNQRVTDSGLLEALKSTIAELHALKENVGYRAGTLDVISKAQEAVFKATGGAQ